MCWDMKNGVVWSSDRRQIEEEKRMETSSIRKVVGRWKRVKTAFQSDIQLRW
jgi:RNA-splicing ligase RtcB